MTNMNPQTSHETEADKIIKDYERVLEMVKISCPTPSLHPWVALREGKIQGLLTAYKNELEFLNSFYNNCKNEKTIFEIHDERDLLNRIQHLESEIKKLNGVVK